MPAHLRSSHQWRLSRLHCLGIMAALIVSAGVTARAAAPSEPASVPFAVRSGPRGSTHFTTLPSEQTGLKAHNTYDDPAMWRQRYREFTLGDIGTILRASRVFRK